MRWAALVFCGLIVGCTAVDEAVLSGAGCVEDRRLEEALGDYADLQRLAPDEAAARYRELSSKLTPDCTDRRLRAAMLLTRRDVVGRLGNNISDDLLAICLAPGQNGAVANLASILQVHLDEVQADIARQQRLEQALSRQHQQIEALKDIERSIQDRAQ